MKNFRLLATRLLLTVMTITISCAAVNAQNANRSGNNNGGGNEKNSGNGNGNKVTLCHNGNTIQVAQNAVAAHLAHGDYLGACRPAQQFVCGNEALLDTAIVRDVNGVTRAIIDNQNQAIAARMQSPTALTISGPPYTIPVAVHIVIDPANPQTNISDQQVFDQIAALNREFNVTNNTGISFCLAQILPDLTTNWTSLNGNGTPGITRVTNGDASNHDINQEQGLLNSVAFGFDPSRYLNIWVVHDIQGGALGYAPRPLIPLSLLDGIVVRFDVFGDNSACSGCYNLIPNYDRGLTLVHEAGHYLGLYHTFQRGAYDMDPSCQNIDCQVDGDLVCDTPPVWNSSSSPIGPNFICAVINTCASDVNLSDPNNPFVINMDDYVNDYMDYTDDNCKNLFTPLQVARMHATIVVLRSVLVSDENLVYTGVGPQCGPVVAVPVPDFYIPTTQVCTNSTLTYLPVITNNTATTWSWTFPGGTPATSSTSGPQVVTYNTPGIYVSDLTVSDGVNTQTYTQTIYVADCTVGIATQSTWYFGNHASLLFAPGVAPSVPAPPPSSMYSDEGVVSLSNNTGTPLFYSNGQEVYDAISHLQYSGPTLNGSPNSPTGPIEGSASQGAVSFPDPANPSQYYIFTVSDFALAISNPLSYSIIDVTTGTIVTANIPVAPGAPITTEHLSAVPDCNNLGYWVVVHGMDVATQSSLLSYHVTAAGVNPVPVVSPSFAIANNSSNAFGQIDFSRDGSRAAIARPSGPCDLYNFDRQTGVFTLAASLPVGAANYGVCFSPDAQFLYTITDGINGFPTGAQILQWDLSNWSCSNYFPFAVVGGNGVYSVTNTLQLGPDDKIYITTSSDNKLSVINFPNLPGTSCGFNLGCIPMINQTPRIGLPNMVDALASPAAEIGFCQTVCNTFQFHSNACGTIYAWDFGDFTTSNLTSPTHAYALPGLYTVTLVVDGNPLPSIQVNATGAPAIFGLVNGDPILAGDIVRLDPATGSTVQTIASVPNFYNVSAGSSTFDPIHGQYMFRGGAFAPTAGSFHYVVDVATGSLTPSPVTDPVTDYQFDISTGRLFGLLIGQYPIRLVEIDPYTGQTIATIATFLTLTNVTTGATTYNPNNHTYIFRGVDYSQAASFHYVVYINNGAVVANQVFDDITEYQYDPVTDRLFGLMYGPLGAISLVDMTVFGGAPISTIATYPSIYNIYNGGATYDAVGQNYYFRGTGLTGEQHFVTNVNSGIVTSTLTTVPVTEYEFYNCAPLCATCRIGHSDEPADQSEQQVLSEIEFLGSQPNPADEQTTFTYHIASESKVTLEVYDLSGKVVLSPVNDIVQGAGDYQIQTNTADLAQGVYYCRLISEHGQSNSKLIITR